jgi:large subunit ribosomal protein L4
MPVVDVLNLEGKTVGQMELADDVFAADVNPHLLHESVRHYLAEKRAGTHKTKDKSEVSGSGKKLWKQKGTGRARVGSIRSPLWRHGGTVHGPTPRSYGYALPKKMIVGALRSALSAKLAQEKLTIIDALTLDSHKTKPFRQTLTKLDGKTRTTLIVETAANVNLERASRNIEGVTLVVATGLETYDLMRHDRLMLTREAATRLGRSLSASKSAEAPAPGASAPAAAPAKKPAAAPAHAASEPEAKKKSATKSAKPAAAKKPAAEKHAAEKKAKPKGKKD